MPDKDLISAATKLLCVIGYPVEHSASPIMHNAILGDLDLDYVYLAFNVHPNQLQNALRGLKTIGTVGINVTIPHKNSVIAFLDEIDPLAKKIGAVNAIKLEGDRLIGRNTDALGAEKSLRDFGFQFTDKKALILGAGGASRAVTFALIYELAEITIVNRSIARARALVQQLKNVADTKINIIDYDHVLIRQELESSHLLVNTTPVGMFPNIDESPLDNILLHEDLMVFDIIYNPLETRLIKDAAQLGCKTLGGLEMLVNQGALAFEWWTGKKPSTDLMKKKIIEFLGIK